MLVALWQGQRIEAEDAPRDGRYHCPGCRGEVILKRGRKVCAHFAHKASTGCVGSRGETRAHLALKSLITQTLRRRGLRAEPEYTMGRVPWERRADVMVWAPRSNIPVAIELQRSSLPIRELEQRAFSYCRMGVAQLWIPFLQPQTWDSAQRCDEEGWIVPRYAPRQHELWIHGLNNHEGYWMADPETRQFWRAYPEAHALTVKEALWYEKGAIKRYREPTTRLSKRYRNLILRGPFSLDDLKISFSERRPERSQYFNWPGGKIATFVQ